MTIAFRPGRARDALRPLASGVFIAALLGAAAAAGAEPPPPWIPDRGDGAYENPVIYADYSDPDVIRVGDDFWLVSSSFNHTPGLPILHSRDLVNWEIVNYALPTQVPKDFYSPVRHGQGVWAPAIRYHDGKYLIYYPDPDFGFYVVTATDPRGAWSAPVVVKAGKGLIDPCPFWDDDGQAYLIHAWAASRGPVANRLSICRLTSDGLRAVDESVDVIDANRLPGWRTLEGPKLYKRNGYYYVFAPAGGVKQGYQAVFRSKRIYGPYENRIVMDQGNTPINGPHQGAWIDTPAGEDWFIHFQDREAFGRVVLLEPMSWRADGWPAMGTAVASGAEKGAPVSVHAKPRIGSTPTSATGASRPRGSAALRVAPVSSDEFDGPALGLQWQWQANTEPDWYSLTARPGVLRLYAQPQRAPDLYDAPNLLLQKFVGPQFTATTVLDGAHLDAGAEAGLIVFGFRYAWVGLRRSSTGLELVHVVNRKHELEYTAGGPAVQESIVALKSSRIFLRVSVGKDSAVAFSFSQDGQTFTPIGTGGFTASVDRWVGATVGVFAARPGSSAAGDHAAGYADFESFRLTR